MFFWRTPLGRASDTLEILEKENMSDNIVCGFTSAQRIPPQVKRQHSQKENMPDDDFVIVYNFQQ